MKRRYTVRQKQGVARRSQPKGWLRRQLDKLLTPRSIIIISEHKTEHVPLSIKRQIVWGIMAFAVVGWGSFITGNYMAAQETLREKEKLIANSHLKNRRIESEFALLKRDLVSMLDAEKSEDLGEYAQFIIKQYRENGNNADAIDVDFSQLGESKHSAVFERIAFLEKTVEEMKHEHEMVLAAIEETAQGKLGGLEAIIASTGLKMKELEKKAQKEMARRDFLESEAGENNPSGGPYNPIYDDWLKTYDNALYEDLRRLVLLTDVVNRLPFNEPMSDYKITSGFGVRIDPFNRRRAMHTGLDFSGEHNAKVLAAADGRVVEAGRKGAYGLMVEVDHGLGVSTIYGHLSRIMVEEGQQLSSGQVLGLQGSTGRSTGNHLHYEVRYLGEPLNPKPFIKASKHVQQTQEESSEQARAGE